MNRQQQKGEPNQNIGVPRHRGDKTRDRGANIKAEEDEFGNWPDIIHGLFSLRFLSYCIA
jgi:hypothetical protein